MIKSRTGKTGFSLVELLVAMGVFLLLMSFLFAMMDQVQKAWLSSKDRIGAFREARIAFESLSSTLSRASLNPYWDYDDANDPSTYVRRSELRFACGPNLLSGDTVTHSVFFQAPLGRTEDGSNLGLETLFNSCGYYIERSDNTENLPPFLRDRVAGQTRFRLMQWLEPSDRFQLFESTSGNPAYASRDWFTFPIEQNINTHVLAENVIALAILPKLPELEDPSGTDLAPDYSYDTSPGRWPPSLPQDRTENQLPPIVQITMVTLDDASAARLESLSESPALFLGLDLLFQDAGKLDEDISTLTTFLNQYGLRHHVFQSAIRIRGSKWSG